jgi:hypothetical protein
MNSTWLQILRATLTQSSCKKKFNTEGNKFEHCVNKLLKNMAKISLIRYLEYYEPYTENMAKLSLARSPDKI